MVLAQGQRSPPRKVVAGAALLAALAFVVVGLAGCTNPQAGPAAPLTNPATADATPTASGLQSPLPSSPPSSPPPPPRTSPPMRFGLDADSLDVQLSSGVVPDYASIWIGPWDLEKGWLAPDRQLAEMRAANVTPAIQLYYWGDDLSPGCLDRGCHGKDQAGWDRLTDELVQHLRADLDGRPVLIVLETEFNKAPVAKYEPLDALLAAKATALKDGYPAARVVLGIGNWNSAAWGTWDRAAAASDAVGLQALAGSARGQAGRDPSLFNETLAGVETLQRLFGKPVILQDVAVPSAPDPATPTTQDAALVPFVARLADLQAAGVEAILYRSFLDTPAMPLTSFYGEAERHFGLAASTGDLKPAGEAWVGGMRSEKAADLTDARPGPPAPAP